MCFSLNLLHEFPQVLFVESHRVHINLYHLPIHLKLLPQIHKLNSPLLSTDISFFCFFIRVIEARYNPSPRSKIEKREEQEMDDEIVRFIVSTDNHLGYCDRDPVRCNDSFAAFEEVLRNAVSRNVDFVLLAGDLFHENKPTRKTMHATLELLRKYCLGPEPVYLEILNDQREIFKSSNKVNYEDPFYSVKLPVFSIHGNHDDPSREGGTGEALAALDLLSISNLVNYFGKTETVDDVEITPILMQKGSTKVALYGIGAIRDERLNRMWNQKRVKFVRLSQEQGRDEFFNIFVIHQNRDYGRGKKNCIHESMIPEWIGKKISIFEIYLNFFG